MPITQKIFYIILHFCSLFKFAKNPSSSKQEYSDRAIEPALTRGRISTMMMRKRKIDDPYESPYGWCNNKILLKKNTLHLLNKT